MASVNDVTFFGVKKFIQSIDPHSVTDDAFDDGDGEGERGGENMDDDVIGVGVVRPATRWWWWWWWWYGKTTKSKPICNDIDDAD